ncbi:MAG: hypothetical protein JOZ19_02675 [Rubrobacter sp.]|nr:hypothetical protein [Rubrobacter sp.]
MRKWMMLVAMLTIVVVAAAPAIAQVTQGFKESRETSGPATPKAAVANSGNNANLCPTVQQTANTGNVGNEQGVTQYDTTTGDIDFGGSSITITPDTTADCTQAIEQSAAA